MLKTSKKLTGYIGFGLRVRASVRSSRTVHARVLKFHVWVPDGKIAGIRFFLSELSPFLELCLFANIINNLSHGSTCIR